MHSLLPARLHSLLRLLVTGETEGENTTDTPFPSIPPSTPLLKVLTLGGGSTFSGGGGPAVIVLHHFSWQLSVGDGAAEGLFYASSEAELGMSASVRLGWVMWGGVAVETCRR